MTDVEIVYELKTVQTIRGFEERTRAKWIADGWEVVAEAPRLVRTTITLRRPKPKTPWRTIGIVAAAVVLGFAAIIVTGVIEDAAHAHKAPARPIAAPTAQQTQTPQSTPTPTHTPSISAPAKAAVLHTFRSFFAKRAASGVVLAKAVTSVSFNSGIVRVTFDPNAAGIDQNTFDSINVYANLAEFASTPIAFDNSVGNKMRPLIAGVETVLPDGTPLGSFDRSDILALNGLSK